MPYKGVSAERESSGRPPAEQWLSIYYPHLAPGQEKETMLTKLCWRKEKIHT